MTPRNSFRYSGVQPSTRPPVKVPGFGELAVGVRVQAADLGQPRVVVREEVLPELTGHGAGLPRGVADDGVAQHAEPLDLDLDDVAGLQQPRRRAGVADAGRGAGGQQVAGPQREGVRDQRERVADGVDHLVGACRPARSRR